QALQTVNPAKDYYVLGGGKSAVGFVDTNIPAMSSITQLTSKQRQHQAKINALAADTRYPLAHAKVSLYLKKAKNNSNNVSFALLSYLNPANMPDQILLGQTTTDAEGHFSLDYRDQVPFGYEVHLTINNPYFEFADYEIPIRKQDGVYDLGELLGLAKTYRLKINVVDKEGTKLDAVNVRLERPWGFYTSPTHQNLKNEVMRDSLSGQRMEVVATGKSGAYWPRAFFSNGYTDAYRIIVEGEGVLRTEEKIHNVNMFCTSEHGLLYAEMDRVPTLTKEIVANIPLPVVEGRVLTQQGEVPAIGAQVMVRKKGTTGNPSMVIVNGLPIFMIDLYARYMTTDSLGKFKVENIAPIQEPYEVVVRYKGKETVYERDLYLSKRGIKEVIDPLFIKAELITVVGKVIDTGGEPVSDATLTWKTGGKAFYSDEEGNFVGSQVEGRHILVSRKPGFKDTEYTVDLKLPPKTSSTNTRPKTGNIAMTGWATTVTASVKNFSGTGLYNNKQVAPKPTPGKSAIANIGVSTIASTSISSVFNNTLALDYHTVFGDGITSEVISSDHVIVMSNFYVKVTVKDHSANTPIANAVVKAEGSTASFTTGADGVTVVEDVPGGNAALIVSGPPDSFYATLKADLSIDASKDTIAVEVKLKAGSRAKGRVLSKGAPLAGAEVAVEGLEHIHALSDENGNYVLSGVPEGEYTLLASLEGLLSDRKTQNFTPNEAYTLDFNLTDPGFNASSLLGFKLVLHKSEPGANANEFIISGELKDIPDNPVYKLAENPGFRIRFTNKVVVKDGNRIYPKDAEMVTDVSEIRLKAFDFLAVTLKKCFRNKAEGNSRYKQKPGRADRRRKH
ncbi:MAG: carboxypeptidase regulatory-like domain-containing protein, partial [Leadbetterella sp.]|nr:carboxypeptidase regulatory-like domain-containing protein [Leadbetterella sp.]